MAAQEERDFGPAKMLGVFVWGSQGHCMKAVASHRTPKEAEPKGAAFESAHDKQATEFPKSGTSAA